MIRLGCWWSRKECPKTVNYEFWKDKEQNSWDTNSPRFQVRKRVSVFQHLLINAKKVASMILRRTDEKIKDFDNKLSKIQKVYNLMYFTFLCTRGQWIRNKRNNSWISCVLQFLLHFWPMTRWHTCWTIQTIDGIEGCINKIQIVIIGNNAGI